MAGIDRKMAKFFPLPSLNPDFVKRADYFFLFETSLFDGNNLRSFIFSRPIDTIAISDLRQVEAAFEKIDRYSRNYYLAGVFAYEMGYAFEDFKSRSFSSSPILRLGVFDRVTCFDHRTGQCASAAKGLFLDHPHAQKFSVHNCRFDLEPDVYRRKIKRIKEYIRRGDTYQVNFTGRLRFSFSGSAIGLYEYLKSQQPVPYGAFCKFGKDTVLSLSPELFFRRDGNKIMTRPMKGTAGRGRDIFDDQRMLKELKNSKNRAENLMIVDLVRNDLGRICQTGSVKVARLFECERHRSLFQMTSTVTGRLKKGATYGDIFRNIFPGGSVTGAPKIRTMGIIRKLEGGPRGVYCGALGMIFPGEKAVFNLPIRTVCLSGGRGEMGVGSGIVYDSDASGEYQECLLKARFLTGGGKDFELLETLRWDSVFHHLTDHLRRMKNSAEYFGYCFPRQEIMAKLQSLERKEFQRGRDYRVRLLVNRSGSIRVEWARLEEKGPSECLKKVTISAKRTNSRDVFYYHKTTRRDLYESEQKIWRARGFWDVLFLNERGEVTEGAISNIVIRKGQRFYTPPVSSGLLPGIYRGFLIKHRGVGEKVFYPKDLKRADEVFLCNSVRGLTKVIFP